MRHELDAREYKLLLNPDRFREASPEMIAGTLWEQHLRALIDERLGTRNGGEPRHEGQLAERSARIVRFWDTPDCMLTRADLALRERSPVDEEGRADGQPEITLKLRMADLFVVAAADLPGNRDGARTTFEEDIAPLEVDDPDPCKQSVIAPAKRSIRSRFARSTRQASDWSGSQPTLGSLKLLFPTIFRSLFIGALPSPFEHRAIELQRRPH